jgi:hypothetical protein
MRDQGCKTLFENMCRKSWKIGASNVYNRDFHDENNICTDIPSDMPFIQKNKYFVMQVLWYNLFPKYSATLLLLAWNVCSLFLKNKWK